MRNYQPARLPHQPGARQWYNVPGAHETCSLMLEEDLSHCVISGPADCICVTSFTGSVSTLQVLSALALHLPPTPPGRIIPTSLQRKLTR